MKKSHQQRKGVSKQQGKYLNVSRPNYTDSLIFPDDITAISGQELGRLLGQYTGLMAYALSELAKLNQEVLRGESVIFRIQAPIRANHAMQGTNQWQSKALLDMKTLEEVNNMNEARIDRELVQSQVNILDRYINALSREMTRRGHERTI